MKLRIKYDGSKVGELDECIEAALLKYGLQFASSGYDFNENMRYLEYEGSSISRKRAKKAARVRSE